MDDQEKARQEFISTGWKPEVGAEVKRIPGVEFEIIPEGSWYKAQAKWHVTHAGDLLQQTGFRDTSKEAKGLAFEFHQKIEARKEEIKSQFGQVKQEEL